MGKEVAAKKQQEASRDGQIYRQRAAGPTLERSPAPVSSRRSRSAAAAPKSRARRASRARSAATRVFVLRGRIRGLRLNIGVDQESLGFRFRLFYMQYHTVQLGL